MMKKTLLASFLSCAALLGPATAGAEDGAKVYAAWCAQCHGKSGEGKKKAPAVRGKSALAKFKTDKDLFVYLKKEMPKDEPGQLSDAEYKAVIAWMRGGK